MGKYTTLTEEIQKYNAMTGIVKTPPPCGCEKQDKEIITSSAMEEALGQETDEDVARQRDEYFRQLEQETSGIWEEAVELMNKINKIV